MIETSRPLSSEVGPHFLSPLMVRLHFLFFSMVRASRSFFWCVPPLSSLSRIIPLLWRLPLNGANAPFLPSQWCGCTFLMLKMVLTPVEIPLNGAAAPFSSILMVL